jgi:hypothetical protein
VSDSNPNLDPQATLVRLRADMAPLGDRYSLALVEYRGGGMPSMAERARQFGLFVPEYGDMAISVRDRGREKIRIPFLSVADEDGLRHLVEMLEQVQTLIIESEGGAWPACPAHNHPLDLSALAGRIAWKCPEAEPVVAWFGELSDTQP